MIAKNWRRQLAVLVLIAATACSHNQNSADDEYYRHEPVPVRVKNENFLDMNVFLVTDTQTRRLGTVPGNTAADFTVEWGIVSGGTFSLAAVPIGGFGRAMSGNLNVGIGQAVEFRVGSVLRQSSAVVYDP